MRAGLIISTVFHIGLLAFAVFSLQNAKALKPAEIKTIPVELVNIAELTKLKAGLKRVKEAKDKAKDDKKAPIAKEITPKKKVKKKKITPERKVEAKAEPEPPAPKKKVEAKPKPKKAEKPAVKPKPKKVVEKVKPKPKPKKKLAKPKKKKKKFNEDKIAALLNKVPDRPNNASKLPDLPNAKKVKGDPRGKALTMSISEIDAFRRQVSQCWNPPVGGLGAENLLVKVRMKLNKDGSLKSQPKVLNKGSSAFFRAAADSATRAIWQCQPYKLPEGKFSLWRDMIINFDPRHMLNGAG